MSASSDDEDFELLTSNVYKPPASKSTPSIIDDSAATTTIPSQHRQSEDYAAADYISSADSVSWSPIDESEELLPAATFTPFPVTTPSTAETTPTTSSAIQSASTPATAGTTTTYVKRPEDGFGSMLGSGGGSGTSTASPRSPRTPTSKITEWTAEECADFLASLGFEMYCEAFLDNEIVGEALVALNHDELRELGISSAGHRLTILKRIYEIKRKQGVSFYKDHYVPITAEEDHDAVTKAEMAHLVQSIRQRDYRIRSVEIELRKLADDYRRMREEFLPVVKMAKDRSQPLPFQPAGSGSGGNGTLTPDYNNGGSTGGGNGKDGDSGSTLAPEKPSGSSLSRTLSKKLFPSKHSPTHPKENHDRDRAGTPVPTGNSNHDHPTLDPQATAFASTGHLPSTTSNNNSHPSPKMAMSLGGNQPSPTSPGFFGISRARTPHGDYDDLSKDRMNSPGSHKTTTPATTVTPAPSISGGALYHTPSVRRAPGVVPSSTAAGNSTMASSSSTHHHHDIPGMETTKSFRVTMDDPCYKVLPAALKKYNINEDWRLYALYIVCGDHERCLELDEKPLILFKQLDREGRKPVFMLRRNTHAPGSSGSIHGGATKSGGGGFGGNSSSVASPGGHGSGNGGHSGGHQHQHSHHQHPHQHQSQHHQHQQQHQHTVKLPGGVL